MLKGTSSKLIALAGAALIIAAAVIGSIVVVGGDDEGGAGAPLPAGELGLELKPLTSDSLGIDPKTSFTLTSTRELSKSQVEASLKVTPTARLDVARQSDGSFTVTPGEPLTPDANYRFTFASERTDAVLASWAYQVAVPLRVVSTLPNNQQSGVPLDTGIEVTFSSDDVVSPDKFVEISPPTPGRFEQHKRTLVFVPQALQPETLYTVTVKPGVTVTGSRATLEEAMTYQFETGIVRHSGPPPPTFNFLRRFNDFTTLSAPLIPVETTDANLKELHLEVFQYPDLQTLVADLSKADQLPSWSSRATISIDTAPLRPVSTVAAPLENYRDFRTAGYQSQPYLRLPDAMSPGFYLLQTRYADKTLQSWLQITDVASYVNVSGTKTLVWVNDVSTGAPIAGGKVELAGAGTLGTANAQGVAEFDTPQTLYDTTVRSSGEYWTRKARGTFIVSDGKGGVAAVPLHPWFAGNTYFGTLYDSQNGAGSDYWRFLTTDRPLYQPADKVSFWGVAKAREGEVKRELTAELRTRGTTRVGTPLKLQTDDFGAFTGEIKLEGLAAGYYTLHVMHGSSTVVSASVSVRQYIKPAYQILAVPSKTALITGEGFDVDVTTQFYDGTPAPGVELKATAGQPYDRNPEQRITTDHAGKARLHLVASSKRATSLFENHVVTLSPVQAEEGEITGSADFVVFPAQVGMALTATADKASGRATINGEVAEVDLAAFEQSSKKAPYYTYSPRGTRPPYLTKPVAGARLTLDITETQYVAIETGEAYDFVNKITYKTYRYQQQKLPVQPTATVTADGQGKFSYSFAINRTSTYTVDVQTKDAQGNVASAQAYASARYDYGFGPFGMARVEAKGAAASSRTFAVGDRVELVFERGEAALPSGGNNRYLFFEAQRGLKRHAVQDNPAYTLTFKDEDVPSVNVGGVFFTGSTYVEAQYGPTLRFDSASRALNIVLTTAQQSYKPGDDATVDVSVTDATGKPVQAEVNLSAVDEALFSVQEFNSYENEILDRLYASVPPGIIRTYVSHQYPVEITGPGGRGGGGGDARQYFPDVAFYGTVRTDANGKGRVTFKLPDSLTSWRLTAFGVTTDLKAGRILDSIAVSEPFFVDVALNPDYVTGDKPVAKLTAYGSKLKAGDEVQVSIQSQSLSNEPLTASGKAFEPISIPLPDLKAGKHEIRVEGSSGSMKDALISTVTVLPSRLLSPVLELRESVKPGDSFKGSTDGQTTLLFANAGRGRFFPALQRLRWTYGDRFDQSMARAQATQLLNQYFDQGLPVQDFASGLYVASARTPGVSSTQGIAPLPFASPDLTTTAHAAALQPELFGAQLLREYLAAVANSTKETPERQAIAFYGLASLGDSVLLQAQALAASPDLGWRGRLYLALALQAAGDDPGARALMDGLIKEFGEDQAPFKRLRAGTDQDDILEATSLMAVLSSGLGNPSADAYFRYVQQNAPTDYPTYLAQLSYVRAGLARSGAGELSFSYSVDGQSKTVALEKGRTWSISLSPSQLASFKVEKVDGSLSATSTYLVPLAGDPSKGSPDLSVRRSLKVVSGQAAGGVVPQSGLVQVTLDFTVGAQAAGDCYQITDFAPSGLKPVTKTALISQQVPGTPPGTPAVIRPNLVSGQMVSFCVGRGTTTSASYYARPSGLGSFVWEPAVINSRSSPSVKALSEPSAVEIR